MIGSGIEKWSEQFDCARGCATISFENGARILADGSPALIVRQKLLKDARQCGWRVRLRKRRELDECVGFKESFDDGFQHLRLARDLDLVTVDATNPWGGGNLLPRGHLREPLNGLARADCIIVTRSEQAQDIDALRKQAARLSGGRPILLSRTRTKALALLSEAMLQSYAETQGGGDAGIKAASPRLAPHPSSLIPHPLPSPIAAFCAIGNPSAFFTHIRHDGNDLKFTRAFPDHHVYVQSDVDALVSEAMQAGALGLLTTAKDAVKLRSLRFELPCYVLEIELEFDDEEKLVRMIRQAIRSDNLESRSLES